MKRMDITLIISLDYTEGKLHLNIYDPKMNVSKMAGNTNPQRTDTEIYNDQVGVFMEYKDNWIYGNLCTQYTIFMG